MDLRRFALPLVALFACTWLCHAEAPSKAAAFLRTTDLPKNARGLQTASVEYRPASGSGPSVLLVGVAHLGSAEYFQAIQQRLDRQTVVLYEGIGIHDVKKGPGAMGDAGIQTTLANALGLKFQLDAIDYRRASFINSDMHMPEIEQEVKKHEPSAPKAGVPKPGAPKGDPFGVGVEVTGDGVGSGQMLDQLVDALQGTGMTGGALSQMIGLLGATPEMREMTKTMLIEVLGQAGELLDMARTASPDMKDLFDVILTQRNQVVMRDLRTQLGSRRAGDSIAIFYGAAHMDEIAQQLRDNLHYVPVKTEWDTAFSANSSESGINPAQIRLMIEMMRSQMQPAGK